MVTKRSRAGEFTEQFTKRLRAARERANRTQDDMARALGITRSGYARLEQGENQMTIADLVKLAGYLGFSTDELLGIPAELTEEEDRLLATFRALDERGRMMVLDMAQSARPKT